MAIDREKVWNRIRQLAKTGTQGYDDQDEYNSKTYSAELRLVELLFDVYEINTKASEALSWLVKTVDLTSASDGKLTLPTDYLHLATIQYSANNNLYPTTKIRTNEIAMTRTSPIRGMSTVKNKVGYYYNGSTIMMLPEASMAVKLTYIAKPVFSTIVLSYTEIDNEFIYEITGGVDFGWPEQMFNILVYLILEQLGVELKEQWLLEFSAYGINKETIQV